MRFIENGPILPDELLNAQDEGQVVFFCGAGVSIADARLPSFSGLADNVLKHLGATKDSLAKRLFLASRELEKTHNLRGALSADLIFGKLSRSFETQDINRAVAETLRPPKKYTLTAHKTILKLAQLSGGQTRLITTNFDLLFENASRGKVNSRTRSNLPRIEYSDNDWGIVHLHGKVRPDYSGPDLDGFVLSSAEFGDAYLAQGWARNFVKDILDRYTAVFIGYSADDPPIRYLLEGLQQANGFKHKLYAFQSSDDDEAVSHWDEKGVEPLVYEVRDGNDHNALWDTLESWATRSRDPQNWKRKILGKARKGPAKLLPHERGMIAHLVKNQNGARAFAQEDPPLTSEWLCVFDDSIRLRQPEKSDALSSKTKFISPYELYRLDDDPPPSGRNQTYKPAPIEVWNVFKLNKKDLELIEEKNLSWVKGNNANFSPDLVPRLGYIAYWISKVSHQRIAVWWAGQQGSLHPDLINKVSYWITNDKTKSVSKDAKNAWNAIFEINDFARRSRHDEFDFESRVESFGWSGPLVREYISIMAPYLSKGILYRSIPRDNRTKFDSRSLVRADVKYPEGLYDLQIPNEYLSKIISGFRSNIEKAIDMESDYAYWLDLCSIVPNDDSDGEDYSRNHDLSGYVLHFIDLYKKLITIDKKTAKQEYKAWRKDAIFIRLRVWACGQEGITDEAEFMEEILSLEGKDFWPYKGERDLLLCLKENWGRLSKESHALIEKKIMNGPPKPRNISHSEQENRSAYYRLNRFHWLNDQGCSLNLDLEALTKELLKKAPEWKQEYAKKAAESHDGRGGWVKTDTDWSSLKELPLSEIISRAEKTQGRDYSQLVEYAPFSGLCDDLPIRAISALAMDLKSGSFSESYWETFLSREKRKEDSLRLKMLICGRMIQIPDLHFKEILLTASRWFESAGPSLRESCPDFFSKLWDKFIHVITLNEKFSGSALIRKEGADVDWASEAINAPTGNLASLHMTDPVKNVKVGEGYPLIWLQRTNELLALPGDAHRYALVILSYNLSWFYNIDPKWTSSYLIEILESETSDIHDKDAVWAGFMWGARTPGTELYLRLKPLLLKMACERLSERKRHTEILSGLLLSGWGSRDNRKRLITDQEFRNVLLDSTDDFRAHVLWHLNKWSSDKKLKWRKQVIPFLKHVWPKHKKVRTARASATLCDIALAQEENFPSVSKLVSQLVSKISNEHFFLPEMRRSGGDIASKYPKDLLDLLYAVLPERPERWPYGIHDLLKVIERSDIKLLNDPRLIDLKSRLNET